MSRDLLTLAQAERVLRKLHPICIHLICLGNPIKCVQTTGAMLLIIYTPIEHMACIEYSYMQS